MIKQTKCKTGRKSIPETERKVMVGIYLPYSQIEQLGGKQVLRNRLLEYSENLIKKTLKKNP